MSTSKQKLQLTCPRHSNQLIYRICSHPDCTYAPSVCADCLIDTPQHASQHKKYFKDIVEYIQLIGERSTTFLENLIPDTQSMNRQQQQGDIFTGRLKFIKDQYVKIRQTINEYTRHIVNKFQQQMEEQQQKLYQKIDEMQSKVQVAADQFKYIAQYRDQQLLLNSFQQQKGKQFDVFLEQFKFLLDENIQQVSQEYTAVKVLRDSYSEVIDLRELQERYRKFYIEIEPRLQQISEKYYNSIVLTRQGDTVQSNNKISIVSYIDIKNLEFKLEDYYQTYSTDKLHAILPLNNHDLVLTCSQSTNMKVISRKSKSNLHSINDAEAAITTLSLLNTQQDIYVIAGSITGKLYVWYYIPSPMQFNLTHIFENAQSTIVNVSYILDLNDKIHFVVGYGNGLLALYNVIDKLLICIAKEHKASITGLSTVQADQYVSSSYDGSVIIWKILQKSKTPHKMVVHNRITDVAPILAVICPIIRQGICITGGLSRVIKVWKLDHGKIEGGVKHEDDLMDMCLIESSKTKDILILAYEKNSISFFKCDKFMNFEIVIKLQHQLLECYFIGYKPSLTILKQRDNFLEVIAVRQCPSHREDKEEDRIFTIWSVSL